jgi:hypothetical protein
VLAKGQPLVSGIVDGAAPGIAAVAINPFPVDTSDDVEPPRREIAEIIDDVRKSVASDSWQSNDGTQGASEFYGRMLVRQTAAIQRQVVGHLDWLEHANSQHVVLRLYRHPLGTVGASGTPLAPVVDAQSWHALMPSAQQIASWNSPLMLLRIQHTRRE